MPGVHAVLTGADYRGDGLDSLLSMAAYQRRAGGPMFLPPRPAIAFDRVIHIG
jgi:aerobic carbon-monoxide dehydrogenase large subunit